MKTKCFLSINSLEFFSSYLFFLIYRGGRKINILQHCGNLYQQKKVLNFFLGGGLFFFATEKHNLHKNKKNFGQLFSGPEDFFFSMTEKKKLA